MSFPDCFLKAASSNSVGLDADRLFNHCFDWHYIATGILSWAGAPDTSRFVRPSHALPRDPIVARCIVVSNARIFTLCYAPAVAESVRHRTDFHRSSAPPAADFSRCRPSFTSVIVANV
jgi:hypothetical protein